MLPLRRASGTQGRRGHRETCAHGVARAKQRAEIDSVHRPQRCGDELVPARMLACPALGGDVLARADSHAWRCHAVVEAMPPISVGQETLMVNGAWRRTWGHRRRD